MSGKKLKSLAILILLLLNGFLLWQVLPAGGQRSREDKELAEGASRLFESRGIDLPAAIIPETADLRELELSQDSASVELGILGVMLENVVYIDDGGESERFINSYLGDNGSAQFRRDGDFTVTVDYGVVPEGDLGDFSAQLLTKAGFTLWGEPQVEEKPDGGAVVTLRQSLYGVPAYFSSVVMRFDSSGLRSVEGSYLTAQQASQGEEGSVSAVAALMAMLSSQDSLGWICERVQSVEQGYVRQESASLGSVRLTPVWRITTDTGAFDVGALSCQVSAASALQ